MFLRGERGEGGGGGMGISRDKIRHYVTFKDLGGEKNGSKNMYRKRKIIRLIFR